jgi:hypothetical protein
VDSNSGPLLLRKSGSARNRTRAYGSVAMNSDHRDRDRDRGGRFPPSVSLKQLEDVLQEEWCKIPLRAAQGLDESIHRMNAAVSKTKGSPALY